MMPVAPDRFLFLRFAVMILADLAVRDRHRSGTVFVANRFTRNVASGHPAERGTDENIRVALAFEALRRFGLSGKAAARVIVRMMKKAEARTRRQAARY